MYADRWGAKKIMVISSFKESITRLLSNVNLQIKSGPTRKGGGGAGGENDPWAHGV